MELTQQQGQLELSRNVHDMQSVNKLREAIKSDDPSALNEAAKQFEAIFVQMMLKSMRKAQDALADENSPFNSQQVKFYRDMHDQQLANDLSSGGGLGLADLIVQQLGPQQEGYMPATALREGANLSAFNRSSVDAIVAAQNEVLASNSKGTTQAYKDAAFASPDEFVAAIMPHAQKAADELGIPAQAIVAQAAVETGWGQYVIHDEQGNSTNNLFGIKANRHWQGEQAVVPTLEFDNGMPVRQQAAFRAYPSVDAAMQDYVSFIQQNGRYAEALRHAGNSEHYFNGLQQAGYATDPNYANKILAVMGSPTLREALK